MQCRPDGELVYASRSSQRLLVWTPEEMIRPGAFAQAGGAAERIRACVNPARFAAARFGGFGFLRILIVIMSEPLRRDRQPRAIPGFKLSLINSLLDVADLRGFG